MYDLHCHLLPGIDDGANHLDDSLALAAMAAADGVRGVVLTPHVHPGRWENTKAIINEATTQLQQALEAASIDLKLAWAGEVRLGDHILSMVSAGEAPLYGEIDGLQLMLLEFPHGHIVPGSEKLVDWLLTRGIRPLIAHPERNKAVMREPESILPFVERGCWLQVTANSITGDFGAPAWQTAQWLLARDLVTVVASDAHNVRYRTPRLSMAREKIHNDYGAARAMRLFETSPASIFHAACQNLPS